MRCRAWLLTADWKASERPWNHFLSESGRPLTVSCDARERGGAVRRQLVEDRGNGLLDDVQLDALVPAREIDIVDLLVAEAEHRRLLARDGRHLEPTAPDELEQGGRHLIAVRDDSLRKQRWHERRREVVRRLVHVLRCRSGWMLATEARVPDAPEHARRDDREEEGCQHPCPRVVERVLELALVARRARRRCLLAGDRRGEDVVVHMDGVGSAGRERRGRIQHAQDHAAMRRHIVDGRPHLAAPHLQPMVEPGRLDPAARAGQRPRRAHAGREHAEPALPLTAPDLRRHLDGIAVRDHDPAQPVAQSERALPAILPVVPDDAQALREVRDPERACPVDAAECGVAAAVVEVAALAHVDVVRGDAVPQWDVAVGAREEAVEAEGQVLAHQYLTGSRERDVDGRLRHGEAPVRERRGGRREPMRRATARATRGLSPAVVREIEERPPPEPERAREEARRQLLDRGVVTLDRVVVDHARESDAILGPRELLRELHEALRGLQLGIGLGDADDAADGRAEALLLAGARRGLCADRRTACLTRSVHQRALMVRRTTPPRR